MIDNERSKRFPFIERSWWPLIPLGAIQHQEQTETLSNRTLSFLQFKFSKVCFKNMCWESCCLYSITWRCGGEKEVHISTFQVNQRRTYINSVKTWLSMVRGRGGIAAGIVWIEQWSELEGKHYDGHIQSWAILGTSNVFLQHCFNLWFISQSGIWAMVYFSM